MFLIFRGFDTITTFGFSPCMNQSGEAQNKKKKKRKSTHACKYTLPGKFSKALKINKNEQQNKTCIIR